MQWRFTHFYLLTCVSFLLVCRPSPPPAPFICITCSLITSVRSMFLCHLMRAFSGYLMWNYILPFPFPHNPYSFFLLYCSPSQVAPSDILSILMIYVFVCNLAFKYRLSECRDFILFTALSLTSGIEPGT